MLSTDSVSITPHVIPSISVVTVVYRDPEGLSVTRNSLLSQNQSIEWIICDGTPETFAPEEFYQLERIRVRHNRSRDSGVYDAMRIGLHQASSEYVIFMNAGDEFDGERSIDVMLDALKMNPGVDVFYFGAKIILPNGKYIIRHARNPSLYIYHSNPGNHQATLYRTAALRSIKYPDGYDICGDYAMDALLHASRYQALSIPRITTRFQTGGRSTFGLKKLWLESWRVQRDILRVHFFLRVFSLLFRILTTGRVFLLHQISKFLAT